MSLFFGDEIPVSKLQNARKSHGLDRHEKIYFLDDFTFWGSASDSIVFTERGYSYKNGENSWFIRWKDIASFEVTEGVRYALDRHGDVLTRWNLPYFHVGNPELEAKVTKLMEELAASNEDEYAEVEDLLDRAEQEENWESICTLSSTLSTEEEPDTLYRAAKFLGQKGLANYHEFKSSSATVPDKSDGRWITAMTAFEDLAQLLGEYGDHPDLENDDVWKRYFYLGSLLSETEDDYLTAVQYSLRAGDRVSQEHQNYLKTKFAQTLPTSERPREVVYITDTFPLGYDEEKLLVFPRESWPTSFKCFGAGHPKRDVMYVVHPHDDMLYLPYLDHDLLLFKEKYSELCRLLQHLGAASIELVSGDSSFLNEAENIEAEAGVTAQGVITSGEAEVSGTESKRTQRQQHRSLGIRQTFGPPRSVNVPDDLVWIESEPEWRTLIKQRLHGGLQSHSVALHTHDISVTTKSQSLEIAAELKKLMVGGSVSFAAQIESSSERDWKSEYKVVVTFHPLPEALAGEAAIQPQIRNSSVLSLEAAEFTQEERDYKEMLAEALEDGVIEPSERRLLERMREKWNISHERAEEIEESLNHTAEEIEYMDEVRFALADNGEISPAERRLLRRLSHSLGISEERAEQLEQACAGDSFSND